MRRVRPFLTTLMLVLLTAGIAGIQACSRYGGMMPPGTFQHVALMNSSYVGADTLAAQAQQYLSPETPLAVGTISDINQIGSSSPLGRMIAEQVATRFVQLGYNVTEVKLRQAIKVQQTADSAAAGGEYVLSRNPRDLAVTEAAHGVISGTYALASNEVLINLRLIDVGTGRILAAHDYAVPMTPDIERLAEGENADFRIFGKGWARE